MAKRKNKDMIYVPIIVERIVKNPKTLFPVNWEERLEEDEYWYEEEPIFDSEGNFTMKRNLFIVEKEVVGFHTFKRKGNNCIKQKPLFELNVNKEDEIKELI